MAANDMHKYCARCGKLLKTIPKGCSLGNTIIPEHKCETIYSNCDCKTWMDNIATYNHDPRSGLTLTGLRTLCGVVIYYCPWCGKQLKMQ